MVSVHWSALPGRSHTAVFTQTHPSLPVKVTVTSYEDENADPVRSMVGTLDSILPALLDYRGRYQLKITHLLGARITEGDRSIFTAVHNALKKCAVLRVIDAHLAFAELA